MIIHDDNNGLVIHADGSANLYTASVGMQNVRIEFQNGTVPDNGVNGMTMEGYLAILIHRTKELNGKHPCRENSLAITKMEEAAMWLDKRTEDRKERSVEGQHKD